MWNLVKILAVSEKKAFKGFTILYMYIAQEQDQIGVHFEKITFQHFPLYKCMGTQIWPYGKKVKGQPMTIILTNLVDLKTLMLYTKNQPQSFFSSGEEDF